MSLTIEKMADYLGKDASVILSENQFNNWVYARSSEKDLEKYQYDYVFKNNGIDFVCDEYDQVSSIFLYFDESQNSRESVKDLKMCSNRHEVIALFGSPSKSGEGLNDPVLGKFGSWDRFICAGYSIHIEYCVGLETISKVTLMRSDVVP